MAEKIIVRQDSNYETEVLGPNPHDPESEKMHPIRNIYELTPYGMLLASLGSCTAVLLNSYAQNHGMELQGVELKLRYERNFKKDCQNCEGINRYEEEVNEDISLSGNLTSKEREKLLLISHHCPIHKMLKDGITVNSQLADDSERKKKF